MIDKNVQQYIEELKKLGIEYTLLEHPQLISVEEVQKYLGYEMEDSAATLVMKADDVFIAIIRRGDTKLDSDKVKKYLGITKLRMATEEEFAKVTGVPSGAASVYIPNTPTFIDNKVFEKEYINAGSGSLLVTIRYKSEDLKKIPHINVVDITSDARATPHAVVQQIVNKRFLSGITPSGDGSLHIGNYLGAVKQFTTLARDHECFLMVADLHALTTVQDKTTLQKNTETLILNELALLGDLKNITFFRQSDVAEHTELQSILNNVTPLGLIKRAHAYKDKLQEDSSEEDINMGLFNYPILMAADILLYKPDLVPVGRDQKQHVEITRDIAGRFNNIFQKKVFKLPESYIPEEVAAILGTDGKRKMSKSLGNIISIFDDEEVIRKQVMGTYTDPTRIHADDPGHIEGNMVFAYLEFFGEKDKVDELKEAYRKGQVADIEVKNYLYEFLLKYFANARQTYKDLVANPKAVKQILEDGAQKARAVAAATMKEVREAIGLNFARSPLAKPTPQGVTFKNQITIEEFGKVEMRVGKVTEAINVEKSEKLIRFVVDFGDLGTRTIFAGVRPYGYMLEDFAGKQFLFVVNLASRKMPSFIKTPTGSVQEESQGMTLCVEDRDGKPLFISAEGMPVGAKIR